MSRDSIYIRKIWTQRKIVVGKWARRRMYLLAFLGMPVLMGAVFLAPGWGDAVAKASEQFSAADNLTTYGYSNAHENFNPAETIITALTARHLKQKWAHKTNSGGTDQPATARLLGLMGWLSTRDEREYERASLVDLHWSDGGCIVRPAGCRRVEFADGDHDQRQIGGHCGWGRCQPLRTGRHYRTSSVEDPVPWFVTERLHLEFAHHLQRQHLYRLGVLW